MPCREESVLLWLIMKANDNKHNRKPKSRWHKWLFGALYVIIVVALFGLFYNFVVRSSGGAASTDSDDGRPVSKYDTIDVIGDYLWPGMKLDTALDEEEDKDKDKDKDEASHTQSAPTIEAEAATEQDIEDATGLSSADPATATTPIEPAQKPEAANTPKIEIIE